MVAVADAAGKEIEEQWWQEKVWAPGRQRPPAGWQGQGAIASGNVLVAAQMPYITTSGGTSVSSAINPTSFTQVSENKPGNKYSASDVVK